MPVTRLLLKTTFGVCILFMLSIVLIRAQPYNDSELRNFLMPPDGCSAPCFMGIRPGETTVEEAIAILQAHEWVKTIDKEHLPSNIAWVWSGLQPHFVNNMQSGNVHIYEDAVRIIGMINTEITLGEMILIYGKPDESWIEYDPSSLLSYYYSSYYSKLKVQLRTPITCPLSLKTILTFRVEDLSFGAPTQATAATRPASIFKANSIKFRNNFLTSC